MASHSTRTIAVRTGVLETTHVTLRRTIGGWITGSPGRVWTFRHDNTGWKTYDSSNPRPSIESYKTLKDAVESALRSKYSPSLIKEAQAMVDEDAKNISDEGTCVLGAGIKVNGRVVVPAPFQGNVASWMASKRAMAFLSDKGLTVSWCDGVMD